ncbi:MAG: cytochrome bc1 complex diheme cytochrome c subunit [Acidimicrobiales bacterium]
MIRRLTKSWFALLAATLLALGLGSVLLWGSSAQASPESGSHATHRSSGTPAPSGTPVPPGAGTRKAPPPTGHAAYPTAGGTHIVNTKPSVTSDASECTQDAERIGYKSPKDSGSPQNSTPAYLKCSHGKVVQYGNSSVVYRLPPTSYIPAGHKLFEENCSSCHLSTAEGSAAAPSLHGVGPATVDFWVTTGRMPAATPLQVQADEKPPRLTDKEAEEVAAWINSLTPSAPYIPDVATQGANLRKGATLFALNCAACHTITGAGDALAYDTYAPSIHNATAQQTAEAIRTGPGNMPRFTGNLSDAQVRDVVAYVASKIEHPTDAGGFGLGGVGPVAEGFVALLFGVGGLMLVCFWIGDRSK